MDNFINAAKEFLDVVNRQSGVYMDSMGGFAGHKTKVSRQVALSMRPVRKELDEQGKEVIFHASYEVEGEPDVVMYKTVRAADFLHANSESGENAEHQARAILVFLFTYWEHEYRPRFASAKGVELHDIKSDIFGDIRHLRNVILHKKGFLDLNDYSKLTVTPCDRILVASLF